MSSALLEYLESRGFAEVEPLGTSTPGLKRKAYENSEFRLHVIQEPGGETYAQVAPIGRPDEVIFLSGVVAYLTGEEEVTREPSKCGAWLERHHTKIAAMLQPSPEGTAELARYFDWQSQFARREQTRLAAQAAEVRARRKPWWRVW